MLVDFHTHLMICQPHQGVQPCQASPVPGGGASTSRVGWAPIGPMVWPSYERESTIRIRKSYKKQY